MKKLVGCALVTLMLSGCLVRTRNTSSRGQHSSANCPPSTHWNGARCEHNGRARGHDKNKPGKGR